MTDLLAARFQMALSLGFHIIFASIGMAMPFLMTVAYARFLRNRDPVFKTLTRAWAKGVAIFFAVGAVSGTALSFELGLLWPEFMKHAGPIVGLPFSLEGAAFFLEAIALGIFLYGWDRVPKGVHWTSGLIVGIAGLLSAFFVIAANGWMNAPAGFDWNDGSPINIDPWAAMFNDALWIEAAHMIVAAFVAVGFAVGGVHAYRNFRRPHRLHEEAMKIALTFGAVAALMQPLIGDIAAKSVAARQPEKLAAMEGLFETQTHAPLLLGGLPDESTEEVRWGIEIPGLLSFLIHGDFEERVQGLDAFPKEDWPPVLVTHVAFQIMVGLGLLLAGVGILFLYHQWRRPAGELPRWLRWIFVGCIPLGFAALEAGWVVTEVGRQPWILYHLLKTEEALTARPGILFTLILYAGIYVTLSWLVTVIMQRQFQALDRQLEGEQ